MIVTQNHATVCEHCYVESMSLPRGPISAPQQHICKLCRRAVIPTHFIYTQWIRIYRNMYSVHMHYKSTLHTSMCGSKKMTNTQATVLSIPANDNIYVMWTLMDSHILTDTQSSNNTHSRRIM